MGGALIVLISGARCAAVVLVAGAVFARVGIAALRFVGPCAGGMRPDWGLGYLAGWFLAGTAVLGLAASGILFPSVAFGMLALLAVASVVSSRREPCLASMISCLRGLGRWEKIMLGILLVPFLIRLGIPESVVDCYLYHLGAIGQWIQAHRVLTVDLPLSHHFPLPFDMGFAYPLLLGSDRAAKGMVFLSFFAGAMGFYRLGGREDRPVALWLGIMVSLSAGTVLHFATVAKNDVVGAACCVIGAASLLNRRFLIGALFSGMGAAAKPVFAPLVLLALVISRLPRSLVVPAGVLLILPMAPWSCKSYLVMGNPFLPFAAQAMPLFGWDQRNWTGFYQHQKSLWIEAAWTPVSFLRAFGRYFVKEQPLLLMALPIALLRGPMRRGLVLCLLAQAVTLYFGHQDRYLLPATWLMVLLVSAQPWMAARRWVAMAIGGASICVAAGHILLTPKGFRIPFGYAMMPPARALERVSPPFEEVIRALRDARAPRVLTCGEMLTYRLQGRIVYGGGLGETPLVWKLASEARNPKEMRKRVRQYGAPVMLYNFVNAKWVQEYTRPFVWDDRMIRLYSAFSAEYLLPYWSSSSCDFVRGGYIIFRIAGTKRPADRQVAYLPGTESLFFQMETAWRGRGLGRVRTEVDSLVNRYPQVIALRAGAAGIYAQLGDWKRTYDLLKPLVDRGVKDSASLSTFGTAAMSLGKYDEAIAALRRAVDWERSREDVTHLLLAQALNGKALERIERGEIGEGEALVDEALAVVSSIGTPSGPEVERSLAERSAFLKGLKGDIRRAVGDRDAAISLYREAVQDAPWLDGSDAWRALIDQLSAGSSPPRF